MSKMYLIPKVMLEGFAIASGSLEEQAGILAMQCMLQGYTLEDFTILSEEPSADALRLFALAEKMFVVAKSIVQQQCKLTKREVEVMQGVAQGLSNKQIGARINISDRTVKFHVGSLMNKYHVRRRMELMQRFHMINPFCDCEEGRPVAILKRMTS